MNPPAQGVWIPYGRVSTDEQARENMSLPGQLAACQRWAALHRDHGVTLGQAVEGRGESAYKPDRPSLDRLREVVRHGRAVGIVVLRANRFARSWTVAGEAAASLTRDGVALRSVLEPDIDETREGMIRLGEAILHGEKESLEKAQLAKALMRMYVEQGRSQWPAPYGYVNQGKHGPSYVVDPERAAVIREVLQCVAAGERPADVIARLRRTGQLLPHRSGRPVTDHAVFKWLKNEAYFGRLIGGGMAGPGDWEPLVDERTFRAAQAVMATRRRPRAARVDGFLLKGVVTCAFCGHTLTGSVSTGRHGDRHAYYHCQPRTKGPHCQRMRRDALDTAFLNALDRLRPDERELAHMSGRRVVHRAGGR